MRRDLVFTAYNRPQYLADTLGVWNGARRLSNWPATFFVEPSEVVADIVETISLLSTSTFVVINAEKLGVLGNPWNALETSFEAGADFVVLAEDDVTVSQDVLEYFEWASIEYVKSSDVLAVNAFSNVGGPKQNQVERRAHFSPLVWGTWRDRWYDTLRDTWDKDYSTGNPDGSEAGWDWNINRIISANDMNVIAPLQSRSSHIGLLGGTHTTPETFPESLGADFSIIRGRQRYIEV